MRRASAAHGIAVRRALRSAPSGCSPRSWLLALVAPASQAAAIVKPRVSLLAIERQAMCVTCKVALDESQSPQANLEREYIQSLIDRGEGEAEIKRSLVAQYGPTVLGLPSAHGFDLAAYLVPLAVVLAPAGDRPAADPQLAAPRPRAGRHDRRLRGAQPRRRRQARVRPRALRLTGPPRLD